MLRSCPSHGRWRENKQAHIKTLSEYMPAFPIPRSHRNKQTPADSHLGRGNTASEHEVPLVHSHIDLQPQALELHFLRFEIFKCYIERDVVECCLCWAQLFRFGFKEPTVGRLNEGEILCMTAITLGDFEEHKILVPPGTAPCGQHFESNHFFVKLVHGVQVPDADGHFT